MKRRAFMRTVGAAGLTWPAWRALAGGEGGGDALATTKIEAIEIFRYDVRVARHFSSGTWRNRVHAFVRMEAGGHEGWAEKIVAINEDDFDVAAWGAFLAPLKGLSLAQALDRVVARREQWGVGNCELAEMALYDLAGRATGRPAVELLGLEERGPVPGLFCILERDPERVAERAQEARRQRLDSHVKVKLFGKTEADLAVVEAAREALPEGAMLLGDPNRGYKDWETLDELAEALGTLRAAGLDACEDPASMDVTQWVELQGKVGELDLVPDAPLRPAWHGIEHARPEMGRVFNLHPKCMGSLRVVARFARKIRDWGRGLMIGDDSLVGPACTAWQQIAVAAGARWVEALEKPGESDAFLGCVKHQATGRDAAGRVVVTDWRPGFGLEVDRERLGEVCGGAVL